LKLTATQAELLLQIADGDDKVAEYYPPAKKLVSLGLCDWSNESLLAQSRLVLTAAGADEVAARRPSSTSAS
jgi:hypothetical protein